MTEISAATQIAASPDQVWAVLADLASYPQWNPLFREASGQLSAGNKITLKSIHPVNGRTMTVKASVLAAEPAKELRWRSSLPAIMTGEHSFTLKPGNGGTLIMQRGAFRGFMVRFSGRALDRAEAGFQSLNGALNARVETFRLFEIAGLDGAKQPRLQVGDDAARAGEQPVAAGDQRGQQPG